MSHRIAVLVVAVLAMASSGCSMIRPSGIGIEANHTSGLLVDGRDSRGLYREDSLDTIGPSIDWQRMLSQRTTFYLVAGAGYKYRERGFETSGSPWVGTVRTGIRFSLDRH